MTPTRTPLAVRGDVPKLLCRGMPCLPTSCGGQYVISEPHGCGDYEDWAVIGTGYYRRRSACTLDWSDRAAVYLSLAWLADRGHVCTWMLPTTHGGRVEAWDGLSAWEVSAILVSVSVLRVARGVGPVSDLALDWDYFDSEICVRYSKRNGASIVRVDDEDWGAVPAGWAMRAPRTTRGPETGDAGKLAADTAALNYDCALLAPGGVIVPEVPGV